MNVTNVRVVVGAGLVIGALAIAGCSGGGANPAASAPAQPTLAGSGALAPGAGAGPGATPGAAQSSSNSTAGGPDTGAPGGAEGAVPGGGEGGVPGGGEAAFATYTDAAGAFSFAYTSGWAKSTDARGAILFQGRNQSVRFRLIANTGSDPTAFATSDAGTLGTEFPGFHQISLAASATLPGAALLTFEWQGTNAVTGKAILEHAERYYIPASGGRMAVLTYSAPPSQFDPQNSADLLAIEGGSIMVFGLLLSVPVGFIIARVLVTLLTSIFSLPVSGVSVSLSPLLILFAVSAGGLLVALILTAQALPRLSLGTTLREE